MSTGDWLEILVILLLIGFNALMASSEVAITRMNRVRAYRLSEEGRRGATFLTKIAENPAPYLNVVLLLTLLATIGGTTIATSLAVRLLGGAGEIVATVVMTLLLFVFAEVTPKTFAIKQTDRVALRLAPLIYAVGRALGPPAKGLLKFANVIMPGKGLPQGPFITEQEIRALADVASEEQQIEKEETQLIHSIFEFGDTIVREVMVPRPDIVAIDATKALRDVQELVLRHGNSRIPVYRGDLDNVLGVVHAKDVLKAIYQGKEDAPLSEVVRKAHFVPEQKKVAELLRQMQLEKFHIALVTDEYGSVSGLVTLEDLLEELVGEITDEYDREEPAVERVDEDTFRVNGGVAISQINELLDVELPDEEWDTVAGLMLGLLGEIPAQGQEVRYQNLTFIAERVQRRRIAQVLIKRVEPREAPAEVGAE
ncbi:MAG: hemolysin family protein [Actinomycetota bacterium]|nr:hemolysin family protein [Actinomycetota bacterium]